MMHLGETFELRAVAHLMRPWGQPARDLEKLRAGIAVAPDEVLFHHTVQYRLRHPRADELAPDDLSGWVGSVVQDAETAERLSFAAQTGGSSAPELRAGLLSVLDTIPPKRRVEHGASEGSEFIFLSATSLSFPTGQVVHDAIEVVDALVETDVGVWFFHLIEEPWFAGEAPLLAWLERRGQSRLAEWLRDAAGSGLPIEKERQRVARRHRSSQIARRVTEAAARPEGERREAGRRAIARLMRRGPGDETPR